MPPKLLVCHSCGAEIFRTNVRVVAVRVVKSIAQSAPIATIATHASRSTCGGHTFFRGWEGKRFLRQLAAEEQR